MAVCVDVTDPCDGVAEPIVGGVAVEHDVGRRVHRPSATKQVRPAPRVGGTRAQHHVHAVQARADDNVRETVAVDIARSGHGPSELIIVHLTHQDDVGGVVHERTAKIDIGRPRGAAATVVVRRAHDDVGVAVPVHVPGAGDRISKPVVRRLAQSSFTGRC